MNWCVRRQFAATNNMAPVDKPAVDTQEPSVLAVADCRKLLVAARDYKDGLLLPYTAISTYLAKHKHEGEAATWAGNSPNIIHRHYKGLVEEADDDEFWSITPTAV